jgi:hypothetical protein
VYKKKKRRRRDTIGDRRGDVGERKSIVGSEGEVEKSIIGEVRRGGR